MQQRSLGTNFEISRFGRRWGRHLIFHYFVSGTPSAAQNYLTGGLLVLK